MIKSRLVLLFLLSICALLILALLLSPRINTPLPLVSPLFLSPLSTLEPRGYLPLVLCDGGCPTATPTPTPTDTPTATATRRPPP